MKLARRAKLLALLAVPFSLLVASSAELDLMLAKRSNRCPRPLPHGTAPPTFKASRHAAGPRGTDSIIRDDFVCNDDVTGGCRQLAPSIAGGGSHGFVVSWYEFRDGDADAWFQRLDSAGNVVGANERLNTDATLGWQGDPGSAMGPDGHFLFAWEDRRDIGNSDVFCQRFDASGSRIDGNFRVSDSGVSGDQSISDAHLGLDGTALIAWDDRRFGLTGDIFAQFLSPDGSPLDTNFRVNDDPVGAANQYEPAVDGDDSGRFVVAWMDGRGINPYDWNVFAQRFDSRGNRLGSNIQVTTNDSIQWAPGVGVASSGGFIVCFDDRRNGGEWDVYAQVYDTSGQPVGSNFRVNDDRGVQDQWNSNAAGNRFGEFIVVWTDRRNTHEDVFAQLYDANGNTIGTNFLINDVSAGNQGGPDACATPDGGFWVTWTDDRDGSFDIYAQRLARDGSMMGSNFRINDDAASSLQRVSSIGMEYGGGILVGWEDERNGGTDIYATVLDEIGNPLGPNLRLNDDGPGGAYQYYTAVAGGKGEFIAAWVDGRSDSYIYSQRVDDQGTPIGANRLVCPDTASDFQWYPYCAMDTFNRAVVVLMNYRDGYRIYGRQFGPDGEPTGPCFPVADSEATQIYASVAMNDAGRFVVAWMDYRNEDRPDIYGQLFNVDGMPIGDNFLVNDGPDHPYQGYPSCAMAEDGSFVVAWEETRHENYDIYLQWFDSTGARVGSGVMVNDGPRDVDCYSPTVDFDSQGRLAVGFNDERNYPGSPDFYCQRYRADRSRISHNQMMNEPRTEPKSSHWTVGQSIAVSEDVVACAWTDNRRHQGFDIYGKLTDWNLVGVSETPGGLRATRDWLTPSVISGRRARLSLAPHEVPAELTLVDVTGRVRFRSTVAHPDGLVDFGSIGRGVYFAVLNGDSGERQSKLVIE